MDSKELTLSMGLIMGRYLCNSESMHYGLWPDDLEVKLENLTQAQRNFTDLIVSSIPEGVKRICEIGSGSGELAERLTSMGYAVDCVCPGNYLAETVRSKLNGSSTVYPCTFQNLDTDQKYDLVLFSESFHYIKLSVLFQKLPTLLNPGGAVLICDFFKRFLRGASEDAGQEELDKKAERCGVGGGHHFEIFLKQLEESPFQVEKDVEITREAARSIDLLGEAYTEVGAPCRDLIFRFLHSEHPILTKVCGPVVRGLFGRKLNKLSRKFEPGTVSAENFAEYKTYRLYVLRLERAVAASSSGS